MRAWHRNGFAGLWPRGTAMGHKRPKRVSAAENLAQAYAELEEIRATIREFPKVIEDRNRKLAEITPLLERVEHEYIDKRRSLLGADFERRKAAITEEVKNRHGLLSRWFEDDLIRKEVKKEIEKAEKAEKAISDRLWNELRAEQMKIIATKEKEQKKEDLWYDPKHWEDDDKYSVGKAAIFAYYGLNYDGKYAPVNPPRFRGYWPDKSGLERAKRDENEMLKAIERLKIAVAEETEEGKLRLKYGIGDDVFAAAAAHFGTTRQLAEKIKDALEGQLTVTKDCPYCGLPLGDAIHADHIYCFEPVGNGNPRSFGLYMIPERGGFPHDYQTTAL